MTLLLIGSTGRTGSHVLECALELGHRVRVLVRDPAKLGTLRERVEIVTGSATDPATVDRAIEGCDAVISVLAPSSPGALEQFTRCAVDSMRRHGVRRIVVLSPPTVPAPSDRPTTVQRLMRFGFTRMRPAAVADHNRQAELLASTDLDWTVVRSVLLVDTGRGRQVKVGSFDRSVGRNMSRADVARFLVEAASTGRLVRELPMVSQS